MSSVQLHQDSQSPGLFCGIVLPLELRMVQDFGFTLLRNAIYRCPRFRRHPCSYIAMVSRKGCGFTPHSSTGHLISDLLGSAILQSYPLLTEGSYLMS